MGYESMRIIKAAKDLVKNPFFTSARDSEPPVSRGMDIMTVETGAGLEEMARLDNPDMVKAATLGYIFREVYGIEYVGGRVDQIMRLSISKNGAGRREIIDVIQAGGALPEAYYMDATKNYRPIEEY